MFHVFLCLFLLRKHIALYVSSAKSYMLAVNDEAVSAADGGMDDRR